MGRTEPATVYQSMPAEPAPRHQRCFIQLWHGQWGQGLQAVRSASPFAAHLLRPPVRHSSLQASVPRLCSCRPCCIHGVWPPEKSGHSHDFIVGLTRRPTAPHLRVPPPPALFSTRQTPTNNTENVWHNSWTLSILLWSSSVITSPSFRTCKKPQAPKHPQPPNAPSWERPYEGRSPKAMRTSPKKSPGQLAGDAKSEPPPRRHLT